MKHPQACPQCATSTMPIDSVMRIETCGLEFPLKLWRYVCQGCGWRWADDAQRAHNQRAFDSAFRKAQYGSGGLWQ